MNSVPAPDSANGRVPRVIKTGLIAFTLAFALLCFPSVTIWMAAFWLAWHSALVLRDRQGWLPLATCLGILVIRLVPRTPAMILFGVVLLVVAFTRFKKHHQSRPRLSIVTTLAIWLAWGAMAFEWRQIENCGRDLVFDSNRPIVCIGDSLTQGMLPDHGYPEQLKSMVSVPVINLGFSGISSGPALGQFDRVLKHNPQIVILEIGGHDFLKGKSRASTKKNLLEMIDRCRAADTDVLLMEIPRGFIIDPFASLEREIAYETDVQLLSDTWLREIILLSPIAPPGRWMSKQSHLSDDGIHSNERGSRAIAKRVHTTLAKMYDL